MQFHCIKMRYSIETRDRIYVKGYGFLSFTKNMGINLSNKYSQKLLDSAKKSTTGAIKTASKRSTQETADVTTDLIGNKIAGKTIIVSTEFYSKHSSTKLKSKESQNENEIEYIYIYIYIYQEKDNRLLMDKDQHNNIIMEYQKIIKLLGDAPGQLSKFRTKNWIETNNLSNGVNKTNSDIRFKTTMLKSSLCDYSHAYILDNGRITITGAGDDVVARQADERNKGVEFKNLAPFTNCKSETIQK